MYRDARGIPLIILAYLTIALGGLPATMIVVPFLPP